MTRSVNTGNLQYLIETDDRVRLLCSQMLGRLDGVHLVGGCVRDLLLGVTPVEIDVAVEGDAVQFAIEFARVSGGSIEQHERFGTATVSTKSGAFDFASTRSEAYERPGALPSVTPATLEQDLKRRDFTVNAIAVSLAPGSFGAVTALADSFADLESKTLRSLHPNSFDDDPTRVWRMCRYSGRLGFAIEAGTEAEARRAVDLGALSNVSLARHGAELLRSCAESEPLGVLETCSEFGLLGWLGVRDFDSKRLRFAEEHFSVHTDSTTLRVASVFWASKVERARLDELLLPRTANAAACEAAVVGDLPVRLKGAKHSDIEKLLSGRTAELAALCAADGVLEEIEIWISRLRSFSPALTGNDLVEAGVAEGPEVAIGLEAARVFQIDEGCSARDQLLLRALAAIDSTQGSAE